MLIPYTCEITVDVCSQLKCAKWTFHSQELITVFLCKYNLLLESTPTILSLHDCKKKKKEKSAERKELFVVKL